MTLRRSSLPLDLEFFLAAGKYREVYYDMLCLPLKCYIDNDKDAMFSWLHDIMLYMYTYHHLTSYIVLTHESINIHGDMYTYNTM